MNRRHSSGVAIVLGAAAGATLSAALASSPVAYADDGNPWAVPVPPYPTYTGFYPPGVQVGPPVNGDQNVDYYVHDPNGLPGNEDILAGTYVMQESSSNFAFPFPTDDAVIFSSGTEKVISSTGGAPPVGTVWDQSSATQEIPVVGNAPEEEIYYDDSSVTTASGATASIDTFFGSTNEYYSGPAGTFDYFSFAGGTPIAFIDDPATTSSTAATDASTLWSDLAGGL